MPRDLAAEDRRVDAPAARDRHDGLLVDVEDDLESRLLVGDLLERGEPETGLGGSGHPGPDELTALAHDLDMAQQSPAVRQEPPVGLDDPVAREGLDTGAEQRRQRGEPGGRDVREIGADRQGPPTVHPGHRREQADLVEGLGGLATRDVAPAGQAEGLGHLRLRAVEDRQPGGLVPEGLEVGHNERAMMTPSRSSPGATRTPPGTRPTSV
ncbi:hypothetical protein ON003_03525 [Janibacter hoylei]|uniref:hypothetical protein n=1 Tax=Janibacter hoylei TaxID=364298 RepID=UPI0022383A3F|nr:hypothetical protein [Janibacter hoylei]MCW4600778.1 hypothetical protein [Janibacter hoylei]